MFLSDSPGPTSAEHVPQRLGFARSGEGISDNSFNQSENSQCGFSIGFYPVTQVFAELWMKNNCPLSL